MPNNKPVNSEDSAKKLAAFRLPKESLQELKELCAFYKKESGFTVSQAEVLERAIKELHSKLFPVEKKKG